MSIISNLQHIRTILKPNVKLVCVSKFHSAETVLQAYDAGERLFGESRVQEFLKKQAALPSDIQWHFIGHLQTNKVKNIVPFVTMVQSVDSGKLLEEINIQAAKIDKKVDCLLEVHIAQEMSKYGFLPNELIDFLEEKKWQKMKNVQICGLMGMATFTDNQSKICSEMQMLNQLFVCLKVDFFNDCDYFSELSMGMTSDYKIAIAQGATIVRIGSAIFGDRK
ncbi:MAG: YggS family pyridoxal phosphate-dependent enzyme [Paludibacter sp.]|nr:YggS family pyridoxal phosphate-dependent enzyme [Paludibacter sp.]